MHRLRPIKAIILALSIVVMAATVACAQRSGGTSNREYRQEVIKAVPFDRLNDQTKQLLDPVLKKPSLYRRLPAASIRIDPEHLRFLVRYPEVVVEIWKLMGVTQLETSRVGPFQVVTNDGAGTTSNVDLIYGDSNVHIFYATGAYEGPLILRKLTGKCVMILRTQHSQEADGTPVAVNTLDVFLKVDNATASLVARGLQPLVGPTADHNFLESMKFLQRLNDTTVRNGAGVTQMAENLDLSVEVRREYQNLATRVFKRYQHQQPAVTATPTVKLSDSPSVLR